MRIGRWILTGVIFLLFSQIAFAKTCSETWGFDCSTGPPETEGDNTFDGCSNGAGGDDSVDEIFLNVSSIPFKEPVKVTCMFDPYSSNSYYYIWYYNGSGWRNLLFEGPTGSLSFVNKTVDFIPDNTAGTHWIRCSISYSLVDNDGCVNAGTYYDNDDINFTVGEEKEEFTKFNISLLKGWNLISFPLNVTNKTLPEPLKSIEGNYSGLFTYNGEWVELEDNDEINDTLGYWINMINDDILFIEGNEFNLLDYDLKQGWNLASYTSLNTTVSNESDSEDIRLGNTTILILTYRDREWLSYLSDKPFELNTLKNITPGYGYWVKYQ